MLKNSAAPASSAALRMSESAYCVSTMMLAAGSAGVAALSGDPVLGPLVTKRPGLAVPGAWNPFEVGVSAVLSGRPDRDSLLGTFVARLGTPVPGLQEGLAYTFPDPARVTSASLAPIGLGQAEASAIAALAAGREIPEVSDFVAFRLGQRDAFPLADPSLQAALAHLGLTFMSADKWYERHKVTDPGVCTVDVSYSALDCGDLAAGASATFSITGTAIEAGTFHYQLALRELVRPFRFVNDHVDGADLQTWNETVALK